MLFDIISTMLKDGRTPEEISDFCRFPLEEIKVVQEKMLVKNG